MSKAERNGERKRRDIRRNPRLGYYIIITDTKETEKNYFEGLKKSFSIELQKHIVIQVKKASTKDLVKTCLEEVSEDPQYRQPWIIFDRDQVSDFDEIIETAGNNDINVGWSNPCIELWFSAYFGEMPTFAGSPQCVSHFKKLFEQKTGTEYTKAIAEIYKKLNNNGDENNAIRIAKTQHKNMVNSCSKPSQMDSTTTLYILVEEIKKAFL